MKKRRKQPLTLIEVMIVISIIGLVIGVLSYNMRGSTEKGKKFKTEQAAAKLEDLLYVLLAEGVAKGTDLAKNPRKYLSKSGYMKEKDIDKLLECGDGVRFNVEYTDKDGFIISNPLDDEVQSQSGSHRNSKLAEADTLTLDQDEEKG